MSFKTRIILYALLPLLLITGAMFFLTSHQVNALSEKELDTFRESLLETKKRGAMNYISLAQAAIRPIIDDPDIDEESAQEQVRTILNNLKYSDDDGYFFVYDQKGKNIVHPFLKHFVGEDKYEAQDITGKLIVQVLLKIAHEGGGFHQYWWLKPSTGTQEEKIAYVVEVERWQWMLGTGFYIDDVTNEVTSIEEQVKNNILRTLYIVLAFTTLSTVLLGFFINWREGRLADKRLRESAHKFVTLQVNERRGFARELHDGINQLMVAAKHRIELTVRQMSKADSEQPQTLVYLRDAENTLNEAIREVRHISHNLRPSLLDDLGLKAALKHLLNQYQERTGLDLDLVYELEGDDDVPEDIEITLYRVIQEALSNIEKHANATSVTLKLRKESNDIALTIQDDGKGFSREQARKQPGIGLQNMRERVELLGGTFKLESSGSSGTTIGIRFAEENV